MARIQNVHIKIEAVLPISLNVTGDLMETQLFATSGRALGTVRGLLFEKWNEGDLFTEPGLHEFVEFVENPVKIHNRGTFVEAKIFAHIEVAVTRYVGEFSEAQAASLKGELGDNGAAEEEVEMPDIPSEWREVPEGEDDPEAEIEFESLVQY